MYGAKTVSVVFPAYNEEREHPPAVEDFLLTGVVDEVVVVDNNSRDRTADGGRRYTAHAWSAKPAQGYGHALRRGLREATGDLVIMAEPDGTFVGRDVLKLLAYSDDFDMVCGTRTTRELIWAAGEHGVVPARGQLAGRQADSGAVRRAVAERLRLHAAAHAPRRRSRASSTISPSAARTSFPRW